MNFAHVEDINFRHKGMEFISNLKRISISALVCLLWFLGLNGRKTCAMPPWRFIITMVRCKCRDQTKDIFPLSADSRKDMIQKCEFLPILIFCQKCLFLPKSVLLPKQCLSAEHHDAILNHFGEYQWILLACQNMYFMPKQSVSADRSSFCRQKLFLQIHRKEV